MYDAVNPAPSSQCLPFPTIGSNNFSADGLVPVGADV